MKLIIESDIVKAGDLIKFLKQHYELYQKDAIIKDKIFIRKPLDKVCDK